MHHQPLTPRERRWRRVRLCVKGAIAFAVIGMALVVGSAGLLLPWIVSHPEKVRTFLEQRLKRPVHFAALHGRWTRVGPVFTLDQVEIGERDATRQPFTIDQAELAIDFYAWLRRGRSFAEFRLLGLDVEAARSVDGRWRLARLGRQGVGTATGAAAVSGYDVLTGLATLTLRDATFSVYDERDDSRMRFERVSLRLANEGGARRFGGVLHVPDSEAALRFACDSRAAETRCHVAGEKLEPAYWLPSMPLAGAIPIGGELDLELWVDWRGGPADIRVEAAVRDLVVRGLIPVRFSDGDEVEPRAALRSREVSAHWRREGAGWRLDLQDAVDGAEASTLAVLATGGDGTPRRYAASADRLELAEYSKLAATLSRLPRIARTALYETAPRGALLDVDVRYSAPGALAATARVEGLALAAGSRTPGIDGLAGRLIADEQAVVLMLDEGLQPTLDYPYVFRQSLPMRLATGTLGLLRGADGWRMEATDLDVAGDGYAARIRASLHFEREGKRPTLDASAVLGGARIEQAKLFWPLNTMPLKTVQWLDRGLVGGELTGGAAVVRGDLDDWPFAQAQGRFEAFANVRDVRLDYHPAWPSAQVGRARANFVNRAMRVTADVGSIAGITIDGASADIDDLDKSVLELHAEGNGTGPKLLEFLRSTPVERKVGNYLLGVGVGGTGKVALDLLLPLDDELKDSVEQRLRGTVDLADADLDDAKWNLHFTKATGRVRFSDHGFAADELAVLLAGEPARLSIATGDFTSNERREVEASLRGELPLRAVLSTFSALDPYVERFPGKSEWVIDLAIAAATAAQAERSVLTLRSNLRGTAIDLPAPLRKDADTALPATVVVSVPAAGGGLQIALGKLLALEARLPTVDKELAASIAFGAHELAPLPATGFAIRGEMPSLDLAGWAGLGAVGLADGGAIDVDVNVGAIDAFGRTFPEMRVQMDQEQGATRVALDGDAVEGMIVLPAAADVAGGIHAEFERLHMPEARPDAKARAFDPGLLPTLHVWAKDLRLGAARLGETRIESFPSAGGMHIERLETRGENLEIRARGDWSLRDGRERTSLDASFTAEDLGKMLDALGYAGIVEGGGTLARIDGSWDGSPAQFGLSRIDGTLEVKVGKGRILDVNPGAGRLFGLVSLQAIPRRLALDFSDFFNKGFAFDKITGRFELRNGNAHTEDLAITGPAAEIHVRGRTGLRQRDYDQDLDVLPRVGGVLPVVGALAGGPAGAAAGVLIQNVLPIDSMARAKYKVTGSWDQPQITLLEKQRGKPSSGP